MTNSNVKKILTYKSGNFVFSNKYSSNELTELLIEINILYRTIDDLPILPTLAAQIQEDIIRRSIFGTAALEGNPLSEKQVGQIIAEPAIVKTKEQSEIEIRNLNEIYEVLRNTNTSSEFKLEEKLIRNIHRIVTKDVEHEYNVPGSYRNNLVQVGDYEHGGVYKPPKCLEDIKNLMKEFVVWINSKEIVSLTPEIRAALTHYHFGLIHPFSDGNGRTARIVEAILLKSSGIKYVPIMLSNYYYRNMDEYFSVFSLTRINKEHSMTEFIKFILKGIVESLNEIKNNITFMIRKFTLKDFYRWLRKDKRITQRQHDLLIVLLDNNYFHKSFGLKDLFSSTFFEILYRNVTEKTARRDLLKLCKASLLIVGENKSYKLNLRAMEQ